MTEELVNTEPNVAAEEPKNDSIDNTIVQAENSSETQQVAVQEKPISANELNIRSLRKEKERLEKENREKDALLEQLAKNNQPEPQVEEEITIADDDFLEGKHYRALANKLKKQEEALNKYRQQTEATSIETKLRNKFTDFDKVVNADNIEALRREQPELAETIGSGNNLYSKAVSAYKIIKKLGIYVEDNFKAERELAQSNSLKPKPLQSVSPQKGSSPLEQANAFGQGHMTKEHKEKLWRETLALSKQSR